MMKLSKRELIEIVRKIMTAEGSEDELDRYMDILEANVPHPEISDLIFYPDKEMTPEEIVDVALSYKPVMM